MSNIDDILDKAQYGTDANFVDMYKNLALHKENEQEFHIFSEKYTPFYFFATLCGFYGFIIMWQGGLNFYSFLLIGFALIIFITSWLHLNNEAISNSFSISNSQEKVQNFEKKWLFNEKNFLAILEDINFHSFSEDDQNLIVNMISTKNANLQALSLIYHQILLQKQASIVSKIKKKEDSENNNFQFFNQLK